MKIKRINVMINIVFVSIVFVLIVIGGRWQGNEKETEGESYHFQILEKDEEISALYTDDTYVYVGTNNGIHIYDAKTLDVINEIDNISMIYTASIIGDGEGGIWVGHEAGLTHIDGEFKQIHFKYPQIPKGRVNVVAMKNGTVYCGTYNGAAEIIKKEGDWKVFRSITKEEGLLCDSVNVILPVKAGILYGSYLEENGGITYISDAGEVSYLDAASGLPHPYITSAIERKDGSILIGTGYMRDGALVELEQSNNGYKIVNTYMTEDGLPGEKIRQIFEDDSTLWITTEYDGVLIKVKEKGKGWMEGKSLYLTKDSGLSDNEIKCIAKVKDTYWLGGKYGLTIVPESIIK